ncbi:MAG: hypothetical protein V3R88_08260 [Alphaproteobacteria bacterium]
MAVTAPVATARDADPPQRLRLVVTQSYAADSAIRDGRVIEGDFAIRRVAPFPSRRLARRLLAHAGATLVDEENAPADGVLAIDVDGTALGRLYDIMENMQRGRSLRFNGALVRGELSLDTGAGTVCVARFAGAVVPGAGIQMSPSRDLREDPGFAPFDKAFDQPGSLVAALAMLVGEVYRRAALTAAQHDADKRIARHAEAALERLAGDGEEGAARPMPTVDCRS